MVASSKFTRFSRAILYQVVFRINFNYVYTDMDNRESAKERGEKKRKMMGGEW